MQTLTFSRKKTTIAVIALTMLIAAAPVRFEWRGGDMRCHSWVPLAERSFSLIDHGSAVDFVNYGKSCEPS